MSLLAAVRGSTAGFHTGSGRALCHRARDNQQIVEISTNPSRVCVCCDYQASWNKDEEWAVPDNDDLPVLAQGLIEELLQISGHVLDVIRLWVLWFVLSAAPVSRNVKVEIEHPAA